jgi:hypothetical protein
MTYIFYGLMVATQKYLAPSLTRLTVVCGCSENLAISLTLACFFARLFFP